MDLFQLTYFVEVAQKKCFTKASKALHISQPSISKGIKALEEHWNYASLTAREKKRRADGNGRIPPSPGIEGIFKRLHGP